MYKLLGTLPRLKHGEIIERLTGIKPDKIVIIELKKVKFLFVFKNGLYLPTNWIQTEPKKVVCAADRLFLRHDAF